jgi:protein-ribulosamine 3-kinase
MLPGKLEDAINQDLLKMGNYGDIREVTYVGGGCINQACRLHTKAGEYFLKWNMNPLPRMFELEASGLKRLRETQAVVVPSVIGSSDTTDENPAYLLLEWIGPLNKMAGRIDMASLGSQLALLHQFDKPADFREVYGLGQDNYIGSNLQSNEWCENWVHYYREYRLLPQHNLAIKNGLMPGQRRHKLERLIQRLETWLSGVARRPSLLHGDLWGGNVIAGVNGEPVLIDPAVYFGDREAEIAFTELFGGFSNKFYDAYQQTCPLEKGYGERRDIYNLYHLVNHLNLFGESYGQQIDSILSYYVG